MSEGLAAARDFTTFGYEPPLSPEPIEGLRIAAPAVPDAPPEPAPTPIPSLPPVAAAPTPPPAPDSRGQEAASAVRYELTLRLVGGERLPLASFEERADAEQRARKVTREMNVGESWPVFGNRYVNPSAVVSVDIDLTGC